MMGCLARLARIGGPPFIMASFSISLLVAASKKRRSRGAWGKLQAKSIAQAEGRAKVKKWCDNRHLHEHPSDEVAAIAQGYLDPCDRRSSDRVSDIGR